MLPRTGVLMQNRGIAFSLDPKPRNPLKPGRRPFHTLNPALAVFDDGRVMSYGSMGGDGQPQFQAQVFTRIAAGPDARRRASPRRAISSAAPGATGSVTRQARGRLRRRGRARRSRGRATRSSGAARRDARPFGHAGALMRVAKGDDRRRARSALGRRRAGL